MRKRAAEVVTGFYHADESEGVAGKILASIAKWLEEANIPNGLPPNG